MEMGRVSKKGRIRQELKTPRVITRSSGKKITGVPVFSRSFSRGPVSGRRTMGSKRRRSSLSMRRTRHRLAP